MEFPIRLRTLMRVYLCLFLWLAASASVAAFEAPPTLLTLPGIQWTPEQKAAILELNHKGVLKIATKIASAVYFPQPDGTNRGFHFNVLKHFADLAGIKIDIKLVAWDDYFSKSGKDLEKVKTDPTYAYTPSLLDEVDLYVDGITVLPWREKLFDILSFVPSRQMVVSLKTRNIRSLRDLNNKTCAMVKDTSMELNLKKLEKANGFHFTYFYVADFDDMDKLVSDGKADFTVFDSDRAFMALHRFDNLTINMPISEIETMGWAINKNASMLRSILEKYLQYAQENQILDQYWKQEYGVTFLDYIGVLRLR